MFVVFIVGMIRVVVAAWIFHEGRLLLVLHKRLGRWLPVGGPVEEGEHITDALRRQVKEEVNLSVAILGPPPLVGDNSSSEELPLPFRVASYAGDDGDELTLDFVALTDDDRITMGDEVQDYQWFTLPELKSSRFVSDRVKALGERAFSYFAEVNTR